MKEEQFFHDKSGSFFKAVTEGDVMTIYLKLASESRSREVGRVILSKRLLEILRDKDKHLFRKNNSYGFNEVLISTGTKFDNVMVRDKDGIYIFPKELILEKGSYLHFKDTGFERQLFLPISEMEQYKVESYL
jgi:hypothetical protein